MTYESAGDMDNQETTPKADSDEKFYEEELSHKRLERRKWVELHHSQNQFKDKILLSLSSATFGILLLATQSLLEPSELDDVTKPMLVGCLCLIALAIFLGVIRVWLQENLYESGVYWLDIQLKAINLKRATNREKAALEQSELKGRELEQEKKFNLRKDFIWIFERLSWGSYFVAVFLIPVLVALVLRE